MNAVLQHKQGCFVLGFFDSSQMEKIETLQNHSKQRVKYEGFTWNSITNVLVIILLASVLGISCTEGKSYGSVFCCSKIVILN